MQLRLLSCSYSLCEGACGVGGGVFVPACPVPARPTWCSPVYSKSFRPGRSMCRTRPGTGCTRRISDRQRATPGPGRPAGCTGRGSGSRSPRTETPAASLEEQDTWHSVHNGPLNKEDCQITLQPLLPINNIIAIIINYCHCYYYQTIIILWRLEEKNVHRKVCKDAPLKACNNKTAYNNQYLIKLPGRGNMLCLQHLYTN